MSVSNHINLDYRRDDLSQDTALDSCFHHKFSKDNELVVCVGCMGLSLLKYFDCRGSLLELIKHLGEFQIASDQIRFQCESLFVGLL